jgi:antirestriction protein ArdC
MNLGDAVQRIVVQVEKDSEEGKQANWKRGWDLGSLPRSYDGREYHGINILFLSGRENPCWITPERITKEGGSLKEGALLHYAVLWKFIKRTEEINGADVTKHIPFLRVYKIYNLADVEGVRTPPWLKKQEALKNRKPLEIIDEAERVAANYISRAKGLEVIHSNEMRAYYIPSKHWINMPSKQMFFSTEAYYDTLFHEMGHSTGHVSLLDRLKGQEWGSFGNTLYSKEELVAELCSAMVCGTLGVSTDDSILNASAYVRGWMKRIKDDPKILVTAASKAEKAARLIMNRVDILKASLEVGPYTTKKGKEMNVVAIKFDGGIPNEDLRSALKREHRAFWCPSDRMWRIRFTPDVVTTVTSLLEREEVMVLKGDE